MQSFRTLEVWEKSHSMTLAVYAETKAFPKEERYGLTSQIRRGSGSIGANIAEGCCNGTDAEFGRFLHIAMGSASELEYHLLVAHDLGYLPAAAYDSLTARVVEVKRMLASLIGRVTGKAPPVGAGVASVLADS